jgi:hypothetical protein
LKTARPVACFSWVNTEKVQILTGKTQEKEEKQMRVFLAAALVAVSLFSLTGCRGNMDPTVPTTTPTQAPTMPTKPSTAPTMPETQPTDGTTQGTDGMMPGTEATHGSGATDATNHTDGSSATDHSNGSEGNGNVPESTSPARTRRTIS